MGKRPFSFFAVLIAILGAAELAKGQTTTFDHINSNVGSQKAITWSTSPHSSGFGHRLISTDPGGKTTLNLQARHNSATWKDALVATSNGWIGIGLNDPLHPFHFLSTSGNRTRFQFGNTTVDLVDYITHPQGFSNSAGLFVSGKDGLIMSGHGYNLKFVTNESGTFIERLRIRPNGNIGIGVTNPTVKLEVNGTIKTKEVNVTATGWPDYVFKPGYDLLPLSEVSKYIQENGHLPNVSTEAEVMENGVNLAEMNVMLLEKVEELTLYLIGHQKRLDELEAENKGLKEQLRQLRDGK